MIALWLALLGAVAQAGDPESGRAIYEARCAVCHGAEGRGDGPAAAGLPIRPRDLTAPSFWHERTDDQVRAVILNGTPSGTMRGHKIKPDRLDHLLAYLHTFRDAPR